MGLGPRLDIRQSQSLVLTPQLTQAIKLLALSNLELEAFVAEELSRNPLLEARSDDEDAPPAPAAETEASEGFDAPDDPGADQLINGQAEDDRPLDHDWNEAASETDSFADLIGGGSGDGEGFDFERVQYTAASLAEHLHDQLLGSSGRTGELARAIAEMLEETGYLTVPLSDVAAVTGAPLAEVERALALVQSLDPPGVGARSLAECLALQAKAADRYDHIVPADAVVPDVFVRRVGRNYVVELNSATLPRLLVNRRYYQELKAGPQDKASKAWLGECLQSANWLVKALDQRARTIVKVVGEIVKRQHGFFEQGVAAMKPLTLREVGEAIEMHESTVSRVTSNKYLLCDRGLFELKYFFSSGVGASEDGGEGASARAVKAAISELIAKERDVLSDEQLVGLLKQRGFDLARRTVVKYREAMGIGSSIQRRRQRKIAGG